MTRRFLSCLLLLLAFQFTWTAISAYCTHESGVAAQHLGHHQHRPDPDAQESSEQLAADSDGTSPTSKKMAHTHCASCAHAALALSAFEPAVYRSLASVAPAFIVPAFSSVVQTPPERPQWRATA